MSTPSRPAAPVMSGARAFLADSLMLELKTLEHAPPPGVFVVPVPGNRTGWAGVLFVCRGPYAGAVLRLRINFPLGYPDRPPEVLVLSEMFHPLIAPGVPYATAAAAAATTTAGPGPAKGFPPGSFSLRHGFPDWFGAEPRRKKGGRTVSAFELLDYIRSAFDSRAVLDGVTVEQANNVSALHAWRAHNHLPPVLVPAQQPAEAAPASIAAPTAVPKTAQWSWDGVWLDRVGRAIEKSVSEQALFGTTPAEKGEDMIVFEEISEEVERAIMNDLHQSADLARASGR